MLPRETVALHYRVDGTANGPVLVFSNSLGCNLHMWDAQVSALEDRFRIVRYDTRGHGLSGHDGAPLTLERLTGDVLALMDHLEIGHAHFCGLSLGGATALQLAVSHPERLDRVVFANTAARIGTPEIWTERIAGVHVGGMAAVRDAALARFLSLPFRERNPEAARKVADMIGKTTPDGYIACSEALRDGDLRSVVGSIAVPSLIIGSELDVSTPPAQSEWLHDAIRESELEIIPNTAHLSCVESPRQFNAALMNFLGR
ncbi:MAG: 3-oxoadipate enol-lactonase [Gemmatimonadaceae bacterium]